jgi:hypothetical protein
MRRVLSLLAASAVLASVGYGSRHAEAAVFEYGAGTYAWVLPPVGYADEDYPRGVRFPMLPTSGFAGIMYTIFGASPSGTGDGRAWDRTGTQPAITNAVPAFCVEKGTEVAYNVYYTSPGKTTTVTVAGFTAGSTVSGAGTGLTASNATADSDGVVEMNVTLSDTATINQSFTLTLTSGATSKQVTVLAADPYKAHDWDASRAVSKTNLGIAAWIATHADNYSAAGIRIATLNNEADPITTTAMAAITQGTDRASVEGAAAQLAIWQVLAGKNVASGTPEANSPIAEYQAANPHSVLAQNRTAGGAFQTTPLQASIDTAVVARAIEIFTAATGDGVIGGANDKTEAEPWHTPVIAVSVDAASATVTVTGTRTSSSGASEPLAGASVTLTGADFDAATAGVQNKVVTLGSSGTGTSPVVLTGATQAITATSSVTLPPGVLLSTAPRGANPSSLQLQQLVTAKATPVAISGTATAPAATVTTTTPTTTTPGSTTTAPASTTTPGATTTAPASTTIADKPEELPFTGPLTALSVILLAGGVGFAGVLLRRRYLA